MPINMVQKFAVEVDSMELLEKYLRLSMVTALNACEEIAVKIVDQYERDDSVRSQGPRALPIIHIGGWYMPETEEKRNFYFNGYGPWATFCFKGKESAIDLAIQHIRELLKKDGKAWGEDFTMKFGDGYNDSFNHFDGSVGLGFELRSRQRFPEELAISIVHMYYGK